MDAPTDRRRTDPDPTPVARPRRERDAHPHYVSEGKGRRRQVMAGRFGEPDRVRRDRAVFARNLDRLTRMHGLTRRAAADKVGATYLWYRQAVTRGLKRVTPEARPAFEGIVREFGLTRPEDLWDPGLIRFERSTGVGGEADAHVHLVWRQREWWPWARKLAHVLASGQHEYLKDQIDALYRLVPKDRLKEPEAGASYWSSDELAEDEDGAGDGEVGPPGRRGR